MLLSKLYRWVSRWIPAFLRTSIRLARLFLVILLGYLLQVTIIPEIQVGGVAPNLLFVVVGVVTVGYGMLQGFWAGAFYGIVLEVMQPTRDLFSLLIYPVAALLGAVLFADKNIRQLEYERSIGRAGRNLSPYFRTPLCTLVNGLVYEIVNVTYIYLREGALAPNAIGRAGMALTATTLLSILLALPIRRLLGFKHRDKQRSNQPQPVR